MEVSTPKVTSCMTLVFFFFYYKTMDLMCQLSASQQTWSGMCWETGIVMGVSFSEDNTALFSLSSGIYVPSALFSAVCPGRRWYDCLVYGCTRIHHSFSASSASPRFCICCPLLERDASLIEAENSIIYGQKHVYLGISLVLFQLR